MLIGTHMLLDAVFFMLIGTHMLLEAVFFMLIGTHYAFLRLLQEA